MKVKATSVPFFQTSSAAPPPAEYAASPMPGIGKTGGGFFFALLSNVPLSIWRTSTVSVLRPFVWVQALYRPSVCALPRPIVTPSALPASAAVTSAHGLSVPAEAADASTRAAVAATSSERIARRLAERAPKAKLLEVRLERARLEAGLR